MEIIKVQNLTYDILKSLNLTDPEWEYISDFLDEDGQHDDILKYQNFVIMTVKDDDKEYTLIHGYPGDNPGGIIYTDDEVYYISDCDVMPHGEDGKWVEDDNGNIIFLINHDLSEKLDILRDK